MKRKKTDQKKQKMSEEVPIEGTEMLTDRDVPDRDEWSPISEESTVPGVPVDRDTTVSLPLGDRVTKDNLVSAEAGTRSESNAPPTEPNENEKTVPLEEIKKSKKNNITVNGVSLMEIMKMKSKSKVKKTPVRKSEKKKDVRKIDSPSSSMGDIRKFMKNKVTPTEENEEKTPINNVKTDLMNTPSHKEAILPKNNEGSMISSSEDTLGNTTKMTFKNIQYPRVLLREVVRKKMSTMDKCGKIVWTMGEVTILKCPTYADMKIVAGTAGMPAEP